MDKLTPSSLRSRLGRTPLTLAALFVPGLLFIAGLFLVSDHPRFAWVRDVSNYPWEFWAIALCGGIATLAGIADWRYHRSGQTTVGAAEHRSELLALVGGGVPLFGLMAAASVIDQPAFLLLPILIVVLATAVLICYDEFVFHRKRCGRYETLLHRLLVFGNALAWLAWVHWCFVREGGHG